jgi:NADPH2:quinone reductase
MRVAVVSSPGGPEVFRVCERPDPVPAPGQLVVRVAAATVNPTDIGARMGMVPPGFRPPPYVPGWDLAGLVTAGDDPSMLGRRVAGMIPWYDIGGAVGAYAEAVAVDAAWVVAVPDGVTETGAATVPVNGQTAVALLELLALPPASELLVTGASGAVGGFLVQLAVAAGHRVTAIAGRDDEQWVESLGAAVTYGRDVDYGSIGTFGYVADVVPVGRRLLPAVADGAVLAVTRPPRPIDPPRGIDVRLVSLRSSQAVLSRLLEQVADGRLRTRVARTYPLEDVAGAHRAAEGGGLHGKIVICP